MAHTIQIKCNGANQHVNEVDLDRALQKTPVVRGAARAGAARDRPERIVLPCRSCTEGKIVLSRSMIDEILGESSEAIRSFSERATFHQHGCSLHTGRR